MHPVVSLHSLLHLQKILQNQGLEEQEGAPSSSYLYSPGTSVSTPSNDDVTTPPPAHVPPRLCEHVQPPDGLPLPGPPVQRLPGLPVTPRLGARPGFLPGLAHEAVPTLPAPDSHQPNHSPLPQHIRV